jgi:pyruvate dehydrogenase E2 component (dihydrolipoamide acetyltransferase)
MAQDILVPNIGDFKSVEIIEVLIQEGQEIEKGDPIIMLESDKSSVEVPSSLSGKIAKIHIKVGDKVSEGSLVASVEGAAIEEKKTNEEISKTKESKPTIVEVGENISDSKDSNYPSTKEKAIQATSPKSSVGAYGASPKVMKFARELGVTISEVHGSGREGRVLEQDIKQHVNQNINKARTPSQVEEPKPKVIESDSLPYEHSEFGEVDIQNIPRIKRLSGPHLVKAWTTIPHVTQHDELDITEMENFRKNLVDLNTREKISITPLAFMMKALVNAMKRFPNFNSSIDNDKVVFKKYFHIGIAVDTPHGLMVPKIRNVDKKNLSELNQEVRAISKLCKELKIDKKEFFGGSMTISSLGGIGGSFFTPIINAPEVSIIGVGKSEMKQVFIDGKFEARMMMPISLSYDHRIIDGAEAAKFCQDLKVSLGRNFSMKLAS